MDLVIGNIGKYLRNLREGNNYSQLKISLAAGLSTRNYQDIEYGVTKCRIDTLAKILNVYGYNIFNFFEGYLIGIFYMHGFEGLSRVIDPESYSYLRVTKEGKIYEAILGSEGISGFKKNQIENLYFWDLFSSSIEKVFVKEMFDLIIKTKAQPVPWTGEIVDINKNTVRVKAYWRYNLNADNEVTDFEIVTFKVT